MPFPALTAAAVAAQLAGYPAAAVVSEYVGTGSPAYLASALAGCVCAAAARGGARALGGEVGPARLGAVAAVQALLAVALAFRMVPGGVDPLAGGGATVAMYAAAAAAALVWCAPGRLSGSR